MISVDKPTVQSKITQFVSKKTFSSSSRKAKKCHKIGTEDTVSSSSTPPIVSLHVTAEIHGGECSQSKARLQPSPTSTGDKSGTDGWHHLSSRLCDYDRLTVASSNQENGHNPVIVIDSTQQMNTQHRNDVAHLGSCESTPQTETRCSRVPSDLLDDKENLACKELVTDNAAPAEMSSQQDCSDSDNPESCYAETEDSHCATPIDDSQPNTVPETQPLRETCPSQNPAAPSTTDYAYLNFMNEIKEDRCKQSTQNVTDWGYFNFAADLKKHDAKQSTQKVPFSMPFTQYP